MPILPTNPIERQAARAILRHALLRWETQACLFGAVAALLILPVADDEAPTVQADNKWSQF